MKKNLVIGILNLILTFECKAQQVVINSNDVNTYLSNLITTKGIVESVDSLIIKDFEPVIPKLQTMKNQEEIEQLLVGTWSGIFRSRINGKEYQTMDSTEFEFFQDYYFKEISHGDTLKGEYYIEADSSSNLVLINDVPQYLYPKHMIENMTAEELEQISYQVRLLNIFELEERKLLFFNVLPIVNYNNPGEITHSRLIVEFYIKK